MKIVFCISDIDHARELADFLIRLRVADAECHLVHVFSPFLVPPSDLVLDERVRSGLKDSNDQERTEMEAQLKSLADDLSERGIAASVSLLTGAPVAEVLRYAEKVDAKLIIVGGRQHHAHGELLLGSVGAAILSSSNRSVLVLKSGRQNRSAPIHAVLAVDHSSYCNQCVELLQKFGLGGIGALSILSVVPEQDLFRVGFALPESFPQYQKALLDHLKQKTEAVADKLRYSSPVDKVKVEIGRPTKSISQFMKDNDAELLILGARGHSWLDRLNLGSVSFHQAIESTYSVLVLRV